MDATRSVYLIDTENQHDWWVGNIKSNTANDKVVLFYSPCAGKAHSVRGGMKGALEILRNS